MAGQGKTLKGANNKLAQLDAPGAFDSEESQREESEGPEEPPLLSPKRDGPAREPTEGDEEKFLKQQAEALAVYEQPKGKASVEPPKERRRERVSASPTGKRGKLAKIGSLSLSPTGDEREQGLSEVTDQAALAEAQLRSPKRKKKKLVGDRKEEKKKGKSEKRPTGLRIGSKSPRERSTEPTEREPKGLARSEPERKGLERPEPERKGLERPEPEGKGKEADKERAKASFSAEDLRRSLEETNRREEEEYAKAEAAKKKGAETEAERRRKVAEAAERRVKETVAPEAQESAGDGFESGLPAATAEEKAQFIREVFPQSAGPTTLPKGEVERTEVGPAEPARKNSPKASEAGSGKQSSGPAVGTGLEATPTEVAATLESLVRTPEPMSALRTPSPKAVSRISPRENKNRVSPEDSKENSDPEPSPSGRPVRGRSRLTSPANVKCRSCTQPGHTKKDCPSKDAKVFFTCCNSFGKHKKKCKERRVTYSEIDVIELDSPLSRDVEKRLQQEPTGSADNPVPVVQLANAPSPDRSERVPLTQLLGRKFELPQRVLEAPLGSPPRQESPPTEPIPERTEPKVDLPAEPIPTGAERKQLPPEPGSEEPKRGSSPSGVVPMEADRQESPPGPQLVSKETLQAALAGAVQSEGPTGRSEAEARSAARALEQLQFAQRSTEREQGENQEPGGDGPLDDDAHTATSDPASSPVPSPGARMGQGPIAPYPLLRVVTHWVSRRNGTVAIQTIREGQPIMQVVPLSIYMGGAEFSQPTTIHFLDGVPRGFFQRRSSACLSESD